MLLIITSILTIVPTILLLQYFYKRDLNPEPREVLIQTFLRGIFIIPAVVIVSYAFRIFLSDGMNPTLHGLYRAFLCAALPEEFFKFWVVIRYSSRHSAFDEPMDGILYGAVASLGFATFENILYVSDGGLYVALARAVTAVPGHACYGAIMGYYAGVSRFGLRPKAYLWLGLLFAVLMHGLYDYALFLWAGGPVTGEISPALLAFIDVGAPLLWVIVMIVNISWVVRLVRQARREQLDRSNASQDGAKTIQQAK